MERIIVELGKRSYPITIDKGLFNNSSSFWPLKYGEKAMLVTNDRIASIYLKSLDKSLTQTNIKLDQVILPDGEKYKSLQALETIFSALLTKSHGRNTTIIALGGGVIGDLAGFAAAIYQRGVRFIQVPTTLLSQVDASVGGKTAINHKLGKNMIGAFYQPASVIIDLNCLNTLPYRELSSGLAEIIKYSIILDYSFFRWLENNLDAILSLEPLALTYCIRHCCELKAKIVATDEYDINQRLLLNLGHTYGHAIETYMGYGNWLHGEAISAGIMMATHTAHIIGHIQNNEVIRIQDLFIRAKLPIKGPPEMSPEDYLPLMMRDKKVITNQLRLILPMTIGKAKICTDVKSDIIKTAIEIANNK